MRMKRKIIGIGQWEKSIEEINEKLLMQRGKIRANERFKILTKRKEDRGRKKQRTGLASRKP